MFPIHDSIPKIRTPFVVYVLIAVNAAIFFYQLSLPESETRLFIYHYAMVPKCYFGLGGVDGGSIAWFDYIPFLSSAFLHGGWLHIIINMWTLFIFGSSLEGRLGSAKFFLFYLCCAVSSTYAHGYFNSASGSPVIGASGAIAGVIGAYVLTFPQARVTLLVPIIIIPFVFSIPAVAFGVVWFGTQVLQGVWEMSAPGVGDRIAWWAHIGGFVSGLVLLPVFLLFAPKPPAPPQPRPPQREWEPGPWDGPNMHDR